MILFSIVRIPSLKELGYSGAQLTEEGLGLLSIQMIGMLVGGIIWGILADKKGRLRILYASILIYSVANIANGLVDTGRWYGIWRFIAGIGLAGELGTGITLVSETIAKEKRGLATTVVASVGIAGAVAAGLIAEIFDWRTCYFIGGGLGLALLAVRIGVTESGMFKGVVNDHKVVKGNIFMLLRAENFGRYLRCIVVGLPVWFVIGVLITLASEYSQVLGIKGVVNGRAIAFCYAGLVFGDMASGLLSQRLKSRKKPMIYFILLSIILAALYHFADHISATLFYALIFANGFAVGYWVLFMTMAAEQFGTNIRATVTNTVPNFVRGALVPMTALFLVLKPSQGLLNAGLLTGLLVYALAIIAWWGMKETFHADLDYNEA